MNEELRLYYLLVVLFIFYSLHYEVKFMQIGYNNACSLGRVVTKSMDNLTMIGHIRRSHHNELLSKIKTSAQCPILMSNYLHASMFGLPYLYTSQ